MFGQYKFSFIVYVLGIILSTSFSFLKNVPDANMEEK